MEIVMNLLGVAIALYVIVMAVNYFPKTRAFFQPEAMAPGPFCRDVWRAAFRDRKWRNRILFTLLAVLAYRLCYFIPLPSVSQESIRRIYELLHLHPPATWVMISTPTGPLLKCRLFVLGLMPYLTACVYLQFFSFMIPPLRRRFYGGQDGFLRVRKYTLMLACVLALVMSYYGARWLEAFEFNGIKLVNGSGVSFILVTMASWLAAFSLILWMANLISRFGVGNGWAVLFCADVVIRILRTAYWVLFAFFKYDPNTDLLPRYRYPVYFLLLGVLVIFLIGVFRWRRNIPAGIGGTEIRLPVTLSRLSNWPALLAQSIVLLPATLASFFPNFPFRIFASFFARGHFLHYALTALLTISLSFFYMLVVVARPGETARLFRRYGVEAGGLSEENQIRGVLGAFYKRMALLTGLLLTLLAVLPDLIMGCLNIPYMMSSLFGGIEFLIVAGIVADTASQLRARREMEKTGCRVECQIVPVEPEALVKQAFLRSKGIPCVIEPYGFTWGLPVRTAASCYKLHVPGDRVSEAVDWLRNG